MTYHKAIQLIRDRGDSFWLVTQRSFHKSAALCLAILYEVSRDIPGWIDYDKTREFYLRNKWIPHHLRDPRWLDYALTWQLAEKTGRLVKITEMGEAFVEGKTCIPRSAFIYNEGEVLGFSDGSNVLFKDALSPKDFRVSRNKGKSYSCECGKTVSDVGMFAFPSFHYAEPASCDVKAIAALKRRDELPFIEDYFSDQAPTDQKRAEWAANVRGYTRENVASRGDSQDLGDIVCHVKLPFDDTPPSEWEPTPIGLSPMQGRMAAIMRHVRSNKAAAQQADIDRRKRAREEKWDF